MDKEPLSGQNLVEVRSMTAIVTISCIKFCLDKGLLSAIYSVVIKYLPRSNAGVYSQLCRVSLEQSHMKEGHFTPDGKHSHLARSSQETILVLVPHRWPWYAPLLTMGNARAWAKLFIVVVLLLLESF